MMMAEGSDEMFSKVYPREKYISKIRPFLGSDIIKVITGIRRCGKSFILKGIINELIADDVISCRGFLNRNPEQQAISMKYAFGL